MRHIFRIGINKDEIANKGHIYHNILHVVYLIQNRTAVRIPKTQNRTHAQDTNRSKLRSLNENISNPSRELTPNNICSILLNRPKFTCSLLTNHDYLLPWGPDIDKEACLTRDRRSTPLNLSACLYQRSLLSSIKVIHVFCFSDPRALSRSQLIFVVCCEEQTARKSWNLMWRVDVFLLKIIICFSVRLIHYGAEWKILESDENFGNPVGIESCD